MDSQEKLRSILLRIKNHWYDLVILSDNVYENNIHSAKVLEYSGVFEFTERTSFISCQIPIVINSTVRYTLTCTRTINGNFKKPTNNINEE